MLIAPTHRVCAGLAWLAMLTALAACTGEPTVSTGEPPANSTAESQAGVPVPATSENLHQWVAERARRLALTEYVPAPATLPPALAALDYDQYREIRFRPEAARWRGEGRFEVQLFHPGGLWTRPVRVNLVEEGRVTPLEFDPGLFDYGEGAEQARAALNSELGWAGLRVHAKAGTENVAREMAVFLGASYFRLLGSEQVHGLSGRGLAIDVGGREEFPVFREFWLVRPQADATQMTLFALLESASVTGAYRFDLTPGRSTALLVDARLWARADIQRLGVAPLTSMYLHGPQRAAEFDDVRPRVHDSEGLLARTRAGEWIWRPLSNRAEPRFSALRDHDPRGFGLVQRDRRFPSYLDLEARYDRRPSVWVQVVPEDSGAGWGSGGVELVELPTASEFNDNIVAYWAPDEPFRAGQERRYRYRLTTFDGRLPEHTLLQVVRLRIGRDGLPGQAGRPATRLRFVVDFAGSEASAATTAAPQPVLVTTAGELSDVAVTRLPDPGWRVTFALEPEAGGQPADMRLFLESGGRRLTETWSYVWYARREP